MTLHSVALENLVEVLDRKKLVLQEVPGHGRLHRPWVNENNARSEAGKTTHPPTAQPKHRENKILNVYKRVQAQVCEHNTKHKVSLHVVHSVCRFSFLQFDNLKSFRFPVVQNKQKQNYSVQQQHRISGSRKVHHPHKLKCRTCHACKDAEMRKRSTGGAGSV